MTPSYKMNWRSFYSSSGITGGQIHNRHETDPRLLCCNVRHNVLIIAIFKPKG